ncbi:protein trichome birefringence-like 1 [Phalaenopsis equestris]|uniref:protein trichome birefringence-like 1 n=1 Tax=Phalaenopsis equestris TaxID=78828 RepID=UPI0009E331D6|nr:protein trichome birefringence-like 1 [Phalaenopsis equestris]
MASSKEAKKLLKNLHQGVPCFQIALTFITVLTTFFFIFPIPHPFTNFSSSSCTTDNLMIPSTSPANTSLFYDKLRFTTLKNKGMRRSRSSHDSNDCDFFDGRWVEGGGEMRALYEAGSCPFVEEAFNCFNNGRPDLNYTRLRWQPKACSLPRLEGRSLLEILRGKRLAFVGDSLNRNMWESLLCILRNSLNNKNGVHDITGKNGFRNENFYAYRNTEYNCTIEFFRAPFLVQEWETRSSNGSRKETLRLDMMDNTSSLYKTADVIIFNTAHWWTHEKTSKGVDFYQEGDHVHKKLSADEAYHKALITWARWVDEHIDAKRTIVFFRGYSWSHFRGGQWNSGGSCDGETSPILEDRHLAKYPNLLKIVELVIREMKTPVLYLNITRMTDYRKEAHPSKYRFKEEKRRLGASQDCSHWCLPGVPDAWNELMYAMLLKRLGR